MFIKLKILRAIIREELEKQIEVSAPYDKRLKDDESHKKKSLIVPDDIKDAIDSYFDDMRMQ